MKVLIVMLFLVVSVMGMSKSNVGACQGGSDTLVVKVDTVKVDTVKVDTVKVDSLKGD